MPVSPIEMLDEILASRRSVRRFRPDALPREAVEAIVAAATRAPSASNAQPWRFLAVSNRALLRRLAEAVREAVARVARHVPVHHRSSFTAYAAYFSRFEEAPLVLVACWRPLTLLSRMAGATLPESDRRAVESLERTSALASAAMSLQNLLLRAHAMGLGATVMTGPLLAGEAVRAILPVGPPWEVLALVAVGYPDEAPRPTPRRPVERVLQWVE